ncbi:MAG: hypothetical protein SFW36_17650, partial [Leptolyngbyaceae cyanobacterium bins.59]|nr:hypothetical protein [Leptolyngbyaceae cyanobacterium bins.59]
MSRFGIVFLAGKGKDAWKRESNAERRTPWKEPLDCNGENYMDNKQLLQEMLRAFRASPLTKAQAFELALQMLAWAKLSLTGNIPPELSLSDELKSPNPAHLLDSFHKLSKCSELGENKAAFESIGSAISTVSPTII